MRRLLQIAFVALAMLGMMRPAFALDPENT